jgi:hypothetical protein
MQNHPYFSAAELMEELKKIRTSALGQSRQAELRRRVLRGVSLLVRTSSTSWVVDAFTRPLPVECLVECARAGCSSQISKVIRAVGVMPQHVKRLSNEVYCGFAIETHGHKAIHNYEFLRELWSCAGEYIWGQIVVFSQHSYSAKVRPLPNDRQLPFGELQAWLSHVIYWELPRALKEVFIGNVARGLVTFVSATRSSAWMTEVFKRDFDLRTSPVFMEMRDGLCDEEYDQIFHMGFAIEHEYAPDADIQYEYLKRLWRAAVEFYQLTLERQTGHRSLNKQSR